MVATPAMTTITTPGKRKKAGFGMGMSPETADVLFAWANTFFIGSLIVGVVAAFLIFVTANVKEAAFKREISDANERIAEASARGDEARAAAATAHERAATLEKEAAVAKLEQERLKALLAWRTISREDATKLRSAFAARPSEIIVEFPANDAEAQYLALQLINIFEAAKWNVATDQSLNTNSILFGFRINGKKTEETSFIKEAFASIGLILSDDEIPEFGMAVTSGDVKTDATRLFVGSKMPPDIGAVPLSEAP